MRINNTTPISTKLYFLIVLSSLLLACNKDNDLLSEYVVSEDNYDFASRLVVDDNYNVQFGTQEVLDVLENDNFTNTIEVTITNVSNPSYGEVTINEDNTLVYVAPENPTEVEDTFTYTTENKDENGQTTSDTGNVTIAISQDVIGNILYTNQAKNVLKERFENGYILGPNFKDDISETILKASDFAANPSAFRPNMTANPEPSNSDGHYFHTTALYAYAIDSVALANVVATELLATVNANNLYTSFWKNSETARWDSDFIGWILAAKVVKYEDSYHFIKDLNTVLSTAEKAAIEDWFERFIYLAFTATKSRIENSLGAGWNTNEPFFNFSSVSTWRPAVYDSNGDPLDYIGTYPQDIFNNRWMDIIGASHHWAVINNDIEMEAYCRAYFKAYFKYGVFSDGTTYEIMRNNDGNHVSGVDYGWSTTEILTLMCHTDAMANHFPNDRLYDYTTSEGILNGSTNLSQFAWAGSSTTDGVTEKGLLKMIKAQAKYLRSEADGGWNDIKFYKKQSDNSLVPLDSEGKIQPSTIAAIANLYYKEQDLVDLYTYNTSVGYPVKQSIHTGSMAPKWDKDVGGNGNMIIGSAWYGQENNFFN